MNNLAELLVCTSAKKLHFTTNRSLEGKNGYLRHSLKSIYFVFYIKSIPKVHNLHFVLTLVGWLGVPFGVRDGQIMPSPGVHGHCIMPQLAFYGRLRGLCVTFTRFTWADLPKVVSCKYLNPVKLRTIMGKTAGVRGGGE